jgi:hypothetical protein
MISKDLWTYGEAAIMRGLPPGPIISLEQSKELHPGSALPLRIADNLLPLSGVQNPTKGDGHTRCLTYPELDVTTLRRGVPSEVPGKALLAIPPDVIPTGTVTRYGPDTLAALILAGANYAFSPIAVAYESTLQAPFLRELSPCMRLGAAAGLGFQAFREQPGLFTTATQAMRIQDAKVNRNLWDAPQKKLRDKKQRYPQKPTTFNLLHIFEGVSEELNLPRTPADIFTENCLKTAQKPGALLLPQDPKHVVPKVIAHPGDFVRSFLEDVGQSPSQTDSLRTPLIRVRLDYANLMAAWIVNDLSRLYHEGDREASFQSANRQLESSMREVLGP